MILADTMVSLLAGLGIAAVTRTQALLGVTGLVLLPLCLLKNLASLAPFSLVGITGMLYTACAMALRYFGGDYVEPAGRFVETAMIQPSFGALGASAVWSPKALILMCMLSNAYIAHFIAPKLYNELRNKTLPRFYQVIGWSFGTSVALYSLITGMGFLTFGAASNGYILNNYSNTDLLMSLSRIAVAISITFSYPLLFTGTRDGILDLFKVKDRSGAMLNKITLVILGIVTAMASRLTDLGLVASLGGATFGTALVFIYPVIMFLKNTQGRAANKSQAETWLARVIGVLGVCMGAIGTAMALQGAEI
jgi:amino acid permease